MPNAQNEAMKNAIKIPYTRNNFSLKNLLVFLSKHCEQHFYQSIINKNRDRS
jgi:hypothetical protein